MRVIRFIDEAGQERLGANPQGNTAELLDGSIAEGLVPTGQSVKVRSLLAPIVPPNLYGVGMNYREHARQMGADIPEAPPLFMKPTTTIASPGAAIEVPAMCQTGPEVDYECELAVVIGREARNVGAGNALDYVFGYMVANEITARTLAKACRTRGKSFDGFCPLGPAIVTADEISDPQNLNLRTVLNGNVMQDGNTGDMIFSVADIISFLSQGTTLLPGTVIVTGTPPGAGFARTPPVFLMPGDVVDVEIDGIGRLTNTIKAAENIAVAA